jgi:peptidoglycan/xylan/chitin deacetylase (PgdA/CDA1 family)
MISNRLHLLFHEVCDIDQCHTTGFSYKANIPYSLSKEQFRQIFSLIEKSSQSGIINEYVFTFDDGGISNMGSAEMLDQFGYKGIFFIPSYYIGRKGFLGRADIRDLDSRGHIIASHTHTHPLPISALNYHKQETEWKLSKEILQQIIGNPIYKAALPGGDYNSDTFPILNRLGYKEVYSSIPIPRLHFKKGELNVYGRICFMRAFSKDFSCKLLEEDPIVYFSLKSKYYFKLTVKRLFPSFFKYFIAKTYLC